MGKMSSNKKETLGEGVYRTKTFADVFVENSARVMVRLSECFSKNCYTFNGQNFNRIVINVCSIWGVLFTWVFFIVIASLRGTEWYLLVPGLISTAIFIGSFMYITILIHGIMHHSNGMNDAVPVRISAEMMVLVTVIIGFFPVALSLIFAVVDTHKQDRVPATIASLIQTGVIYFVTFILWLPYAFCATPRHVFDTSNWA